jgi:hypothetical protein
MGRRLVWCSVLVPLLLVVIHAIACGDPSHVFEGRYYLQHRDCLGTTASIDVVEGDSPERPCPAVCLAQPQSDGGRAIYVTAMCAPYPHLFDASGNDSLCSPALAALARSDTCLVDGGSAHPLPPPPAPTDAASE